jgi:WD40 repeat protein
MKCLSSILTLMVIVGFCRFGSAQTEYVLVNINSITENAGNLYELDTATGALTLIKVLPTGGTGLTAINFSDVEQAITQNAECVFIADTGTSDIAAFSKATGYEKVGNYTNVNVAFDYQGGSISATPNGKFLYASYSQSENIGAWQINSDCSLTFIASYYPSGDAYPYSVLKVTPNGLYMIMGSSDQFSIDQNTGALVDLGRLPECPCASSGIDFTRDSKIAVFAAVQTVYLARITSTGLKDPMSWILTTRQQADGIANPFFSAAAYSGSGDLYFGAIGGGGQNLPSAVITTNFTEKPPKLSLKNITRVNSPKSYDGNIASTGNLMVVAEFPNEIGVFQINSDGSLTQLATTTVTGDAPGVFSLSVFPNTR